jgi:hypothetical protein
MIINIILRRSYSEYFFILFNVMNICEEEYYVTSKFQKKYECEIDLFII